jgi:hypothetical protein
VKACPDTRWEFFREARKRGRGRPRYKQGCFPERFVSQKAVRGADWQRHRMGPGLAGGGARATGDASGAEFVTDRGGDVKGEGAHAVFGFGFDHDAGERLGAGKADNNAAVAIQFLLGGFDGVAHFGNLG